MRILVRRYSVEHLWAVLRGARDDPTPLHIVHVIAWDCWSFSAPFCMLCECACDVAYEARVQWGERAHYTHIDAMCAACLFRLGLRAATTPMCSAAS